MTATTAPEKIGTCQHCGVGQFNNPNADRALGAIAHLCWKCVKPWRAATDDSWADSYTKGWNASKRADQRDGADADMDAAVARFTKRFPELNADAYVTGWNDQAVGNDFDTNTH